jgi:hypothetical protein
MFGFGKKTSTTAGAQASESSLSPAMAAAENALKQALLVRDNQSPQPIAAFKLLDPHYKIDEVRRGNPHFRFEYASTVFLIAQNLHDPEQKTKALQSALSDFLKIRSDSSAPETLRLEAGVSVIAILTKAGKLKDAKTELDNLVALLNPPAAEGQTPPANKRGHGLLTLAHGYMCLKGGKNDNSREAYNNLPDSLKYRPGAIAHMYDTIESLVLSRAIATPVQTPDPNDTDEFTAITTNEDLAFKLISTEDSPLAKTSPQASLKPKPPQEGEGGAGVTANLNPKPKPPTGGPLSAAANVAASGASPAKGPKSGLPPLELADEPPAPGKK